MEVTDRDLLQAYHDVEVAAFEHDFVALPADPLDEHLATLEGHQDAGSQISMFVGLSGERPVTTVFLRLSTLDNLTSGNVDVHVHPAHRRGGLGRQALGFALDRLRAQGRTRAFVEAPRLASGEEGPAFPLLRSVGGRPVLDDVRRVLDLQRFPVGVPPDPPAGYRVVQWVDTAPDDLVDGLAYLLYRMVLDAPMGDMDYEPEAWDAARYRATEVDARRRNRTRVSTAVVHEATGQVAGMTEVGVNGTRRDVAYQWNTIVDPHHRGKRLGLVLKSWNHAYLVDQVAGVRYVNTWNAASNHYMIAVNEALGFRPAETWTEWQLEL